MFKKFINSYLTRHFTSKINIIQIGNIYIYTQGQVGPEDPEQPGAGEGAGEPVQGGGQAIHLPGKQHHGITDENRTLRRL